MDRDLGTGGTVWVGRCLSFGTGWRVRQWTGLGKVGWTDRQDRWVGQMEDRTLGFGGGPLPPSQPTASLFLAPSLSPTPPLSLSAAL